MQKVYLGGSGMKVSELCLGAVRQNYRQTYPVYFSHVWGLQMTFGLKGGPSPNWNLPTVGLEDSFKILNRFAEAGGSFIDT